MTLPYKIAVLCYLYDREGRVLLLHRRQDPNRGMYSPIGGKLDFAAGEAPHDCALREIEEETGVRLARDELRMLGIVTERSYEHEAHWLIFLFEALRPVQPDELKWTEFAEGTLEWRASADVPGLPIPRTDRDVMWPLVQAHRGGFFMVHVDWTDEEITWKVHESIKRGILPSDGGQEVQHGGG